MPFGKKPLSEIGRVERRGAGFRAHMLIDGAAIRGPTRKNNEEAEADLTRMRAAPSRDLVAGVAQELQRSIEAAVERAVCDIGCVGPHPSGGFRARMSVSRKDIEGPTRNDKAEAEADLARMRAAPSRDAASNVALELKRASRGH